MELTVEERQAVENGDVVKYVIPGSHVGCVVVREDMLDPCAPDWTIRPATRTTLPR